MNTKDDVNTLLGVQRERLDDSDNESTRKFAASGLSALPLHYQEMAC